MLAGGGQQSILQLVHKRVAIVREQLHLILGGLVAAQDAVLRVVAAAIHGGGHDIVHAQHACALGAQDALGARAGVDIAGNHLVGILQNIGRIVGEDHVGVGRKGTVILDIIHAGEGMDGVVAKHLAEALVIKALTVRIHALFIQRIPGQQGIAHLVGRIAQLHHYALGRSHGHRPQQNAEAIAAEDGKQNADGAFAQLIADILGDLLAGGIVALGAADNGLRHRHDVAVMQGKFLGLRRAAHALRDRRDQIVALLKNRGYNASCRYARCTHEI